LSRAANAGAHVVVTDIVATQARRPSRRCAPPVGEATFIEADLAVVSDIERLVAESVAINGRLHGAFNNAGVEQCAKPLHELPTEQWERAIRVDLTSVFWCIKYRCLAMLRDRRRLDRQQRPRRWARSRSRMPCEYVAASTALSGSPARRRRTTAARGIRVNAVLPGIVRTPMIARLSEDPGFKAFFERLRIGTRSVASVSRRRSARPSPGCCRIRVVHERRGDGRRRRLPVH
jgi:NAD(P)-dependent dehydrogenase (short-subunit alcohol dehydrogenase family)